MLNTHSKKADCRTTRYARVRKDGIDIVSAGVRLDPEVLTSQA